MRRTSPWLLVALASLGCGGPTAPPPEPVPPPAPVRVVLSVVGTSDLHGHVRALPILGGYLHNLRARPTPDDADQAGVVLLDGGDMFQGTLESNLLEGAPVVTAYGMLGYDAVAIGNHEFDYGPVGERSSASEPGDDPRGALLARAAEAGFPFLNANLRVATSHAPVEWAHVAPSALFAKAGVMVGVIGVTTESTLTTTLASNVADLEIEPLTEAIAEQAASLRQRGADVVLLAAHAGGICESFDDPDDLSVCQPGQEIFQVLEALPPRTLDAVVAGHTHHAVAHRVNGTPVIQSNAYGVAFGRVDLSLVDGRVVGSTLFAPHSLCESGSFEDGTCEPGEYEGAPVEADASVEAAIAPAVVNAAELRNEQLGVTLADPVERSRTVECALGNLFVDLMRASHEGVDVALTNGGGLRADLPPGPLTYGSLYEAMPFDNRFAIVHLSAAQLRAIIAANVAHDGSFFSLSGVRARATCDGDTIRVELTRENGRRIPDDAMLSVVTTDFLATGGDGLFGGPSPPEVEVEPGELVRDGMARVLRARGGTMRARDLFDPRHPRVAFEGDRPMRCPP
ncbi:MAG: bifunctional UDP-sugar hydrolase/5'-nucleotidase [Sandaracinaceae bacterium]